MTCINTRSHSHKLRRIIEYAFPFCRVDQLVQKSVSVLSNQAIDYFLSGEFRYVGQQKNEHQEITLNCIATISFRFISLPAASSSQSTDRQTDTILNPSPRRSHHFYFPFNVPMSQKTFGECSLLCIWWSAGVCMRAHLWASIHR